MTITLEIEREDAKWLANWLRHWQRPSLADIREQITDAIDREDERAWDESQQSLRESGGADDSHYRAQMRDAGRRHLLP